MPVPAVIDNDARRELSEACGRNAVLTEPEHLEDYSRDETPGLAETPGAAVLPSCPGEVRAVLEVASRRGIPVTPRGTGTGLAGGAVPTPGGLVLGFERMNRIIELDEENLTVTVEAGAITGNLREAVERKGLFYPPDPASLESCSIGGNLATNAGGPMAVKYGVTRSYLAGLEAVLAGGKTLTWGGKTRKNSTGYGLGHLLVGSEGTLAAITRATLRLLPLPRRRLDLWAAFASARAAADAVGRIRREGVDPAALELVGAATANLLEEIEVFCPRRKGAEVYLLVELDGDEPDFEKAGGILDETGALDILVAETRPERERIWEARRKITEAIKAHSPDHSRQDIAVPPAAIPALLEGLEKLGGEGKTETAVFGHAGDGNLHVSLLRGDLAEGEWLERSARLEAALLELAVELGGVISGEHGIGLVKRKHLGRNYPGAGIPAMRAIKQALDPDGILNPGKVLP